MACKPDSVLDDAQRHITRDDHSSDAPVTRRALAANPDLLGFKHPRLVARGPYLALLPVGLAVPLTLPLARWALTPPFHHDLRIEGRLFSVALSLGLPPPGVTRHRALWSPDFPRYYYRSHPAIRADPQLGPSGVHVNGETPRQIADHACINGVERPGCVRSEPHPKHLQ